MAAEYGEFRVDDVVEVCQSCGWNHLATSYVSALASQPYAGGGVRGPVSEPSR